MNYTLKVLAALLVACAPALCQGPPPGGGPPGGGPPGGAGGGEQGDGIWVRNAGYGELHTFDSCNGHQPGNGQYHHHVNPVCLRLQLDDNVETARTTRSLTWFREKSSGWTHSPILGWAADGYPIYGPYGYSDPKDAHSPIRRIKSGFRLRSITTRTSLPEWALPLHAGVSAQLTPAQYGPEINPLFPLGRYQEDFEWVAGLGDLDQSNGRTTVTPEFPQGTYAYFITIADDGTPVFPYIIGGQYFGNPSGGTARNVPAGLADYFARGTLSQAPSTAPVLASWLTKYSTQNARVATGSDPSATAKTTWSGVTSPAAADVQSIRTSDSSVYVGASGLASYVMGPWFDMLQPGGVFGNLPTNQNLTYQLPRAPAVATSRTATGLGAIGMWVNGVAVFNILDGGSYSNARKADVGGGGVAPTTVNVSAASLERGPLAPGSFVSAFPFFGSVTGTSTATAATTPWPTELGGTTVNVRDAAGTTHAARIYYVSPSQINYQIPEAAATGNATVTISAGGTSSTANIQIDATYPNLFFSDASEIAAALVTRVHAGQQSNEAVSQTAPIDLGAAGDEVYLTLYGTGLGKASGVTAAVAGIPAEVKFAGPQGGYSGLDQYNVLLPRSLAGKGRVGITVTAGGRISNTVYVTIR